MAGVIVLLLVADTFATGVLLMRVKLFQKYSAELARDVAQLESLAADLDVRLSRAESEIVKLSV